MQRNRHRHRISLTWCRPRRAAAVELEAAATTEPLHAAAAGSCRLQRRLAHCSQRGRASLITVHPCPIGQAWSSEPSSRAKTERGYQCQAASETECCESVPVAGMGEGPCRRAKWGRTCERWREAAAAAARSLPRTPYAKAEEPL